MHIALNIASDSSVAVDMSNMVNTALHVSLNNAARCQVDVKIDKAYNSSIHLRLELVTIYRVTHLDSQDLPLT